MTDWKANELNEVERELVEIYTGLLGVLRDKSGDLKPFERFNVQKALGSMWQIMNGLDMDPGQLYEEGV